MKLTETYTTDISEKGILFVKIWVLANYPFNNGSLYEIMDGT